MADNFAFQFEMDWTSAATSTKRFFNQIKTELKQLNAEADHLAGPRDKDTGKRALPASDADQKRLAQLEAAAKTPQAVVDRASSLVESTKRQALERANVVLAGEQAAAQKLRITEEKAIAAKSLATNEEYLKATQELAVRRRQQAAAERKAALQPFLNAAPDQLAAVRAAARAAPKDKSAQLAKTQANVANAVLNQEARNAINKDLAGAQASTRRLTRIKDDKEGFGGLAGYSKSIAAGTVARETEAKAIQAAISEKKAADESYLREVARAAVAKREEAAAIQQATVTQLAGKPELQKLEAENNVRSSRIAAQRASVEAKILLGDEATLREKARQAILEREVSIATNKHAAAELQAAIASGQVSRGTKFQQLQARLGGRQGGTPRLPQEFQTLGQFAGSKALTTAGFALSGAAFFGILQGIRSTVDETKKLETNFALIQAQLAQMGRSADFGPLKDGILSVARESGIAGSEIAFLALQLRGAFSEEIAAKGIGFLNTQLAAAGKIARTTSLPLAEVTDSLTGLAKTFNISFQEIGGVTLFLQQRFGVLAKETITFAADIGPVAKQAGLSFRELATIGASIQRLSGRGGAQIAESLGRILPSIQENGVQVLNVFDQIPKLQGSADKIANNLAKGRTGPILKEIIKNYDSLTKAQQNTIATALGGKREAQTLNALFSNTGATVDALNKIKGINAGSILDQQFKKLQGTLQLTLDQLKQSALQLGVSLLNSGILDFVKDLATGLKLLLTALTPILAAFKALTGFLNGGQAGGGDILGKIATAAVAVQAVKFFKQPSAFTNPAARTNAGAGAGGLLNALSFGLFGRRQGRGGTSPTALTVTGDAETRGFIGLPAQGAAAGQKLGTRISTGIKGFANNLIVPMNSAAAETTKGAGLFAKLKAATIGGQGSTVRSLASSGAGLLFGIAAILEVADVVSQTREKIDAMAAKFRDQIATRIEKNPSALRADALAMKARGEGTFSTFESLISSQDSPVDIAIDEANDRIHAIQEATFKALNKSGIRAVHNLKKKIAENQKGAGQVAGGGRAVFGQGLPAVDTTTDYKDLTREDATKLTQLYGKNLKQAADSIPGARKIIQNALKAAKFEDFTKRAKSGALSGDIATTEALFKSGQISFNQYVGSLLTARKQLLRLITQSEGEATPQFSKEFAETDAKLREAQSTVVKKRIDTMLNIRRVTGKDNDSTDIAILASAFADKKFTDPVQRADVLNQAYTTLGTIFKDRIAAAKTAAEKLAIGRAGQAIPEAFQVAAARQTVDNAFAVSRVSGVTLQKLAQATGGGVDDLYDKIAAIARNNDLTIKQATITVIRGLITDTIHAITRLGEIQGRKKHGKKRLANQMQALWAQVLGFEELLRQVSKDKSPDLNAGIPDAGPITLGAAEQKDLANQARDEARQRSDEARQAARTLAEARLDYFKALVENDPVQAAQAEIKSADIAAYVAQLEINAAQAQLATAQGANEKATAQAAIVTAQAAAVSAAAQRIRAQNTLRKAIEDIGNAMLELGQAMADAAGDSVGSANIALQLAQRKLALLKAESAPDQAAILRAQADVVRQQAALRDSQIAEQEATIDFNLQTKKISKAQAIAELEALLASADVLQFTQQQRRDLVLKIQALRGDLARDLQFNLPSELRLPTLYEARRLNQTGGAYQDNRTINISLSASGQFDGDAAVRNIINAVNQPPVFGTRPRIY